MYNRILNFLEINNSLYENQYGFRPGRSCEHALLNAKSSILEALNKRQISLLLLIDFSKAFDLVEHSVLLKKLEHYGIRGPALAWMRSYLDNRKQYVSINGSESSTTSMEYGVPQGSVLGHLLFIIYINDIPEVARFAKFILYADDANIIITANTIEEINEQVIDLTNSLLKWVNCNGLSLNLIKTQYMIFSRQKVDLPSPLFISTKLIERKQEAKFLGIIVDESLNWSKHVETLQSKMSRYVGIMYKLMKFLPLRARLQIYHSFVQSHINYCSLVWGFSSKSNLNTISSKQKKGLRAVMPGYVNYKYKKGILPDHTKSAFSEYKILTIHNIIAFNALLLLHKAKHFHSLVPSSVRSTISEESPGPGSNYETCENWLKIYGNHIYAKSLFFKGPLILANSKINENLSPASFVTLKAYKSNVKQALLIRQGDGDVNVWQTNNYVLYNTSGLRKSKADKERVIYTAFFD